VAQSGGRASSSGLYPEDRCNGRGYGRAAMEPDRFLELLEQDGARLASVARRGALDREIPTCPGWTVGDCVAHTADVYQHKIACMRLQQRPEEYQGEPPAGIAVIDWFDTSLAALLAELRDRGPAAPSYTWWPADQTVGFWYRRMAQETAVHRLDVEDARGQPTAIDPELAIDGIDELLDAFMGDGWDTVTPDEWGAVDPHAAEGQTIAVHAGGRTWCSTLGPDRIALARHDAPSQASVAGEPEAVLLWLWGRRPDSVVELDGEPSALTAFRDRLWIATQ
jgi:uncharacterized protein (TIGR03083 family)